MNTDRTISTIAIIIIALACLHTYKHARYAEVQISKERTKYEIIEKCNYTNRPTEQCVDKLSKSLNVK